MAANPVREWAKTQGIELGDRGRIPDDIVKRYEESTGQTYATQRSVPTQQSGSRVSLFVVRIGNEQAEQMLGLLGPVGVKIEGTLSEYVAKHL